MNNKVLVAGTLCEDNKICVVGDLHMDEVLGSEALVVGGES